MRSLGGYILLRSKELGRIHFGAFIWGEELSYMSKTFHEEEPANPV